MAKPEPAYDGTEPYVFVSYAHADSDEVFDQIAWMQSMGLNVWYDEGIEPGSRWTDFLAEKVLGSSLVLYMVTEQSVASVHCRNEIEFALETDRPILLVYLEPAELASGQRLTLSSKQAILKYEIGRDDYSRKLVDAVTSALDTSVSEVIPAPANRRSRVALVSTVAGVLLLSVISWYFLSEPPVVRAADDLLPVVIADLANDTDDRLFNGSLEEVLRVGLQVAPFVDVRDSRALRRQAREQVGEETLSMDTARLLAARENIELVIGPRIVSAGRDYLLEVQAVDPVTGETRASSSGKVSERAEVLNEMTRQAQLLRVQLGDSNSTADQFADSFSTNSLDALNAYVEAQQAAFGWDHKTAAQLYQKATEQDPDFGRAYSGWAYSVRELGREDEAAELFAKAVATLGGAQERERLRTLGLYYATVTLNYQKADETFSELLEKYPADTASLNNLTMLAFLSGRFDDAAASGAELVERFPDEPLYGGNLALFQMYASEIRAAAQTASQVLELHPDYYLAYLPLAIEAALGGNYRAAEDAYRSMAELGDTAARRANLGLIDLALTRGDAVLAQRSHRGRFATCERRGCNLRAAEAAIDECQSRSCKCARIRHPEPSSLGAVLAGRGRPSARRSGYHHNGPGAARWRDQP